MKYEKYKAFVLNYKPFEWEVEASEFRENFKGKHTFISSFVRFYKVFLYLEKLKEDNLKAPKILDVGAFPGNMPILSKKISFYKYQSSLSSIFGFFKSSSFNFSR